MKQSRSFFCKAPETIVFLALVVLTVSSCSTSQNTTASRFYQSTITHYNTWYNGNEALRKGIDAQERAFKDNYIDLLTLSPLYDQEAAAAGKSNFETAIEKAQKCIKLHSITAKPKDKSIESKNEYNPFLWHAWFLLADGQMHHGDFLEASGTYSYIARIYQNEPHIVTQARMKEAECYSALGWNYEADELFSRIQADSIPAAIKGEYASIRAAHLLQLGRNEEAISYLEEAIMSQKTSKSQKIRQKYLLGQLYKLQGDNKKAYNSFGKVIKMNPPYIIEFNARIQQTETMSGTASQAMLNKLKKIGRDPKNKDYQEQVYYAIGNVLLAGGDTLGAIDNYETGLEEATRNGEEKGILLQHLADLYWEKSDYADAQRCYSEAVGLMDKDNPNYETVKLRSSVLEYLTSYTESIHLQDSLQRLSKMPEEQIYTIIDNIIEELIEEEARQAEEARLAMRAEGEAAEQAAAVTVAANNGQWYFYNQNLVKTGMSTFTQTWGRRKLEDDWRRSNKSILTSESEESVMIDSTVVLSSVETTETDNGNVLPEETTEETLTLSTDPHTRDYYYQQIPFSSDAKAESDAILTDALLNAGIIYKDDLSETGLANSYFRRITSQYPTSEEADDAWYQLYLMNSLSGNETGAQDAIYILKTEYTESEFTAIVSNPDFREDAIYGKHREDSLYAAAYQAYLEGNTAIVKNYNRLSSERYPKGQHRPKFMFLYATTLLKDGDTEGFAQTLQDIAQNYPENEIAPLAGSIVSGLRSGKVLQSGTISSIWETRASIADPQTTPDSLKEDFQADRNIPFLMVMAYPKDSLNRNQLLFEMARYNFTGYMMRNFEIEFKEHLSLELLQVSEFLNFDEAYTYRKRLWSDPHMAQVLEGIRAFIITPQNLELLMKYYSFSEYEEFYEKNFLEIPENMIHGDTLFEMNYGDE